MVRFRSATSRRRRGGVRPADAAVVHPDDQEGGDGVAARRLCHGGVYWVPHERMDHFLAWMCPLGWTMDHRVAENCVQIHCSPPWPPSLASRKGSGPTPPPRDAVAGGSGAHDATSVRPSSSPPVVVSVHGLVISSFAYRDKIKVTDEIALLRTFIAQFSRSVGNSVTVVATSWSDPSLSMANGVNPAGQERCRRVCEIAGGASAVCEVTFKPPRCAVTAKGLCRAFYHSNKRFHSVVTFAVPEDEYAAVSDLVVFGVGRVTEHRDANSTL